MKKGVEVEVEVEVGMEVEGVLDRIGDGDIGDDEEDFQEAKKLLRDGC